MARNIAKSPDDDKKDKTGSFEDNKSEERKIKTKKKERNSWDSSSSTTTTIQITPKSKHSNWDLSSDCHETMVEPFNEKIKECSCLNFDTGSQDVLRPSSPQESEAKLISRSGSSVSSVDISVTDVSEANRNSLFDMFNAISEKKSNVYSLTKRNPGEILEKEDSLLVEDLEEFLKDSGRVSSGNEWSPTQQSEHKNGNHWNHTEGTADDTTIWMIPKSERSLSISSNSKLSSTTEKEKSDRPEKVNTMVKKAKSSSNIKKRERNINKSSRSECLNNKETEKIDLSDLLMKCEGSNFCDKLKIQHKTDKSEKNFDEAGIYFTEYECRTMTLDNDEPRKTGTSTSFCINTNEGVNEAGVNDNETTIMMDNENRNAESENHDMALAGPSTQAFLEVVSLPDITGRNSMKERQNKEKINRRKNSPGKNRTEPETKPRQVIGINQINESWFLLDETGQYQAVRFLK